MCFSFKSFLLFFELLLLLFFFTIISLFFCFTCLLLVIFLSFSLLFTFFFLHSTHYTSLPLSCAWWLTCEIVEYSRNTRHIVDYFSHHSFNYLKKIKINILIKNYLKIIYSHRQLFTAWNHRYTRHKIIRYEWSQDNRSLS